MKFWDKILKRSPKKIKKEREKIELLVNIKKLVEVCNNLIVRCDKRLNHTVDDNIKSRLKFILDKLKQTLHHLDDAYAYLDAINTKFTIDELKQAAKEIYNEGLDDHLGFFIHSDSKIKNNSKIEDEIYKDPTNEYKFYKRDKDSLQYIRTNISLLIKTLPEYKLE
ncbi:MAG: hypothetical protein AABX61_03850 [Nanoarchaeota archaeon]